MPGRVLLALVLAALTAGASAAVAGAEPADPPPPELGLIALTRAAALGDAHPASAGFLAMTYERAWGRSRAGRSCSRPDSRLRSLRSRRGPFTSSC